MDINIYTDLIFNSAFPCFLSCVPTPSLSLTVLSFPHAPSFPTLPSSPFLSHFVISFLLFYFLPLFLSLFFFLIIAVIRQIYILLGDVIGNPWNQVAV